MKEIASIINDALSVKEPDIQDLKDRVSKLCENHLYMFNILRSKIMQNAQCPSTLYIKKW